MPILINRHSGLEEQAVVVSPIEQQDIDCYETQWRPILEAKVSALRAQGALTAQILADHNVEDAHWGWPQKFAARSGQLQWNSYAVRCAGQTQGLMYLNVLKRCRLPSQLNEHMIYVDLLATAPWNRHVLTANPLFRGTGLILLTEAIQQSRVDGFDGRIALHALPGAADFYEKRVGMRSMGADHAYDGLLYFEMTGADANAFLSV